MKLILKYLCLGLSVGCILFVLSCMIGIQTGGTAFAESLVKDFSSQAMGYMVTGIVCAVAAIVYRLDQIPWGVRILIHFVMGMGAFSAVSLYLGWFSFRPEQIGDTLRNMAIFCGGFMVLWIFFFLSYRYNCREAKKINDRLRELEPDGGMKGK